MPGNPWGGGQLRRYSDLDTPTAEQTGRMRTLTYGFAVLLAYWKQEFEADALADLRTRIEGLEDAAGISELRRRLTALEGSP